MVDRANAAADVDVDVDVAASPPPLVRHRSSSISSADSAGGTAVLHTPWLSVGGTHPCWVGKAGLGNGEEEEGGWKMGFRVRGGNERGFEQEIGVGIGVVKDGGGGGVEVREVEVQVEMGVGMAF